MMELVDKADGRPPQRRARVVAESPAGRTAHDHIAAVGPLEQSGDTAAGSTCPRPTDRPAPRSRHAGWKPTLPAAHADHPRLFECPFDAVQRRAASLIAQRLHRIETRGPPRWIEHRQERQAERHGDDTDYVEVSTTDGSCERK